MPTAVWDQIEDRQYETGIDRGLIMAVDLYGSSVAVPWNGLISVSESNSRESKEYFQDGVKIYERLLPATSSIKIKAFTYPDLVEELLGNRALMPGARIKNQKPQQFHMSYRTRIGSALDGVDHGYKLHFLWNLTLNPDDASFDTIGESVEPIAFEWAAKAAPSVFQSGELGEDNRYVFDHLVVDSRELDPLRLEWIERDTYANYAGTPYEADAITYGYQPYIMDAGSYLTYFNPSWTP